MRAAMALVLIFSAFFPCIACAARTVSSDQPFTVRLEVLQQVSISFPEALSKVICGLPATHITMDGVGSHLILQALDPTINHRLFAIGQSGTLYTVLLQVKSPADDRIDVRTPEAAPGQAKAQPLTVSGFLRALKAGIPIPDSQPADVPLPTVPEASVNLSSIGAISIGTTIGLALTVHNSSPRPLRLDIRAGMEAGVSDGVVHLSTWIWPPRLTIRAIAVDEEMLGVDGQTRLCVVLERRP